MNYKYWLAGSTTALLTLGMISTVQGAKETTNLEESGEKRGKRGSDERRGHRPPPLNEIIAEFDANGDGKLDRTEAPERFPDRIFEHLDTNEDGAIDLAEAEEGMRMREARGPREKGEGRGEGKGNRSGGKRRGGGEKERSSGDTNRNFEQVLERFDLNADGILQSDEAPDRMMRMFARLDSNGDGAVDSHEANSFGSRSREQSDREKHDAKGERRGPRGEHGERERRGERRRNPLLNVFDNIDANGDGVLDKSEVEAYEIKEGRRPHGDERPRGPKGDKEKSDEAPVE